MSASTQENSDSSIAQNPNVKRLLRKEHPSQILSQLNQFRLSNQLTDAVLLVDEEELHCHRCVLAASSPYFKASFSNQFQEAISARVTMRDMSPWIMKRILDYIYTGQLDITVDNAQDYLRIGHMLHYPDIVDVCCELLCEHLHIDNCIGIKEYAGLFGCQALERDAHRYVLEHFVELADKSEELLELSFDSLKAYLFDDRLDIPKELVIWRAIKRWVLHDVDRRKSQLLSLISCMRLCAMSTSDLNILVHDQLARSHPASLCLLEKVMRFPADSNHHLKPSINGQSKLKGYQREIESLCFSDQKEPRPSTIPRQMIVLLGSHVEYELSYVVIYDPVKGRWKELPSLPERIVKASVTASYDALYVTGGIVNNRLSDRLWKFCCSEKRWKREMPMMFGRSHHSSAVMGQTLFVTGGLGIDDSDSISPVNEIHAYDINACQWTKVGLSSSPRMQAVLFGFNNTLYELGGQTDGCFMNTMAAYVYSSVSHQLKSTDEHYVLPCRHEPGPLRAVLDESNVIYIFWEHTGQLFSVSTLERKYVPVCETSPRTSACLAFVGSKVYVLGGAVNGKPCTEGLIFDTISSTWTKFEMATQRLLHSCVSAVMVWPS